MLFMSEGGEVKLQTNINAMLEQLGMSVNNDSVIRKTFHKYLHPKEAFIANGILNPELIRYGVINTNIIIVLFRVANGQQKE